MVNTHRVVPVPAYDVYGELLTPTQYWPDLESAVVQIRFTLQHWKITLKNEPSNDAYVADIVHLRVLVPPPNKVPMTPHKQKVSKTDPFQSLAKKKGKAKAS